MAFSRSARIITLLVIDSLFFLLEIIVGYAVHSLALVADSFHMLNDVFSLLVALWAIKLAKQKSTSNYTYGWQRAEVLGALVNGVFLLALCLSIFLEAIQRFFEPQEISNPMLVLAVGSAGLASNILGLFLFHDHGHSHGDTKSDVETGHGGGAAAHGHERHKHTHGQEGHIHHPAESDSGDIEDVLPDTVVARLSRPISAPAGSKKKTRSERSRARHFASPVTDIHVSPYRNRQEVIAAARSDTDQSSTTISSASDSDSESRAPEPTSRTPLLPAADRNRKRAYSRSCHQNHNHSKPKAKKSSSHSHDNLNMRGVFLHVLGDALGNVGVIAVALALMFLPAETSWRHLLDPVISLIITVIIFSSALPLCKSASKILLQGVPKGISLEEVKQDIASVHGVESVHELHIWQLSDVKMIASLHIQIAFDPECEGGGRYMQLASAIRTCLHGYGIHSSTIQPEYTKEQAELGGSSRRGNPREDDACLLECGEGCVSGRCCSAGEEAAT